ADPHPYSATPTGEIRPRRRRPRRPRRQQRGLQRRHRLRGAGARVGAVPRCPGGRARDGRAFGDHGQHRHWRKRGGTERHPRQERRDTRRRAGRGRQRSRPGPRVRRIRRWRDGRRQEPRGHLVNASPHGGDRLSVALLTREYPPEVYGGAGVHVEYLARELAPLVRLTVHCQGADRPGAVAHQAWDRLAGANQALQTVSADLSMTAAVASADLVHSHTWYANLAGHLAALLY